MKLMYRKHPNNVVILNDDGTELGTMVRYRYFDKTVLNHLTGEERNLISKLEDSEKCMHIHSISLKLEEASDSDMLEVLCQFEIDTKAQGFSSIMLFVTAELLTIIENKGYEKLAYLGSANLFLIRKDLSKVTENENIEKQLEFSH